MFKVLFIFSLVLNIVIIYLYFLRIRRQEDKILHQLFNVGFPVLIVSDKGNIIKANEFASNFYGIPLEELEKKSVFDINTASKEYLLNFLKRGLNKYQRCIFTHRTKDGEKEVQTNVIPILYHGKKRLLCIIEDISDKEKIKTELILKEELLRNIYDNAKVCILIYDEELNILKASPWCFRLLGYEEKELVNKKMTDIFDEDKDMLNALKPEPYQKITSILKLKAKDKTLVYAKCISSVIIHEGNMLNIATIYDIQKEVQEREKYRELSEIDTLTKAHNRRAFEEAVEFLISNYKNKTGAFSIIMFDIDDFKKINDTYGHDAGDITLKKISEIVLNNIRQEDIFCRIGGEEFVLILKSVNIFDAFSVAEKLRKLIENTPIHYDNFSINITCSFGIAEFDKSDTKKSLFKKADLALYVSKTSGKNMSYMFFGSPMRYKTHRAKVYYGPICLRKGGTSSFLVHPHSSNVLSIKSLSSFVFDIRYSINSFRFSLKVSTS